MSPPKTRRQTNTQKQISKQAKRAKQLFANKNVIGPRDVAVNMGLGKVKLEPAEVKPEIAVMQIGEENLGDTVQVEESSGHAETVVKEEVDIPLGRDNEVNNAVGEELSTEIKAEIDHKLVQVIFCENNFKWVLPHIRQDLNFASILVLRQVCKSWQHAVDNFLENHPNLRPHGKEVPQEFKTNRVSSPFDPFPLVCRGHYWPKAKPPIVICSTTSVQFSWSEYARMQYNDRNFFVGRTVQFGPPDNIEWPPEFWNLVLELLEAQGSHVWHVSLDFGVTVENYNLYRIFQKRLTKLVNVKSLVLIGGHPDDPKKSDSILEWEITSETYPLPTLAFLESLDIRQFYMPNFIELPIASNFVANHLPTLKALRVAKQNETLVKSEFHSFLYELDVPDNYIAFYASESCSLLNTNLLTSKLSKLTMSVDSCFTLVEVLNYLKKFPGLYTLKLDCKENSRLFDDSTVKDSPSLCVQGVKFLELNLSKQNTCYNFLKYFPSLNAIHLNNVAEENYEISESKFFEDNKKSLALKQVMKAKSCQGSSADVWKYFSKLQTITMHWDGCSSTVRLAREACENRVLEET